MNQHKCIELKRIELIEVVTKFGMSSEFTLKKSEELDCLIIQLQALSQPSNEKET